MAPELRAKGSEGTVQTGRQKEKDLQFAFNSMGWWDDAVLVSGNLLSGSALLEENGAGQGGRVPGR